MKRITKLAAGAFTGAAVVLAPLALTGTANAETGTVITLEPTGAQRAAAAKVIHCTIVAHNPHYSHHADAKNRSMVNVVGTVKCDHKVARISIRVGLYKNGHLYKQSGVKSNTGKSSISQNAARRCVKRQKYTGVAVASVVAPPGYTPPTASGRSVSKTVYISACKKGG
ncbi:hypothetical protein [Actinomadura gamaensis]|uniref:Uncharacterized protein n=1 Tax=Actinomadura gamaensis TaxID=1763541 RepID=A0ABV9TP64_9ACTN